MYVILNLHLIEKKRFFFLLLHFIFSSEGHYMLVASEWSQSISSAARLISYPQPADQVICVSFLYHMFGSDIGMCSTVYRKTQFNPEVHTEESYSNL